MGASSTRKRFRRSGAVLVSLGLVLGMVAAFGTGTSSAVTGLDFAAAAPGTYDHTSPPANATSTFGYGDGSNDFVVEQLEGGDYDCDQIVPFFTKIDLGGDESVDLSYTFDRFTTGHKDGEPGVGYRDIVGVTASTSDTAHTATGASFTWGESADAAHTYATATVSGLGENDVFILRVDVKIGCDAGAVPKDNTGNLLAHLDANLPGGAQTVPMKSAANILVPPRMASLTVVKNAVPDDPQDFTFHISSTETAFVLDDGVDADGYTSETVFVLESGTYTVTETVVSGWAFSGVVCSDETSSAVTPTVSVTLAADDDVTCTFTNTKETPSTTIPYVPPEIVTTVAPTTTLPPTTTTEAPAVAPAEITVAPTTVAPAVLGVQLARTGAMTWYLLMIAGLMLVTGGALLAAGSGKVQTLRDER